MAADEEIIFPIVECPIGPHDVLPGQISYEGQSYGVNLLICPQHQVLLNTDRLPIKEWVTTEELARRGYERTDVDPT